MVILFRYLGPRELSNNQTPTPTPKPTPTVTPKQPTPTMTPQPKKPQIGLMSIIEKITKGVEVSRKDGKAYQASNIKIAEGFKNELSSGNCISKSFSSSLSINSPLCFVWINLSYSDFMNPVKFLQDRIEMFNERILGDRNELYIGNLDSINARLRITEEKSPIKSESPHRLRGTLEYDDGYILELPEIYAGKTNDKYIVYGIQKTTEDAPIDETSYVKAIRKGLISKINGAPEHYILMIMAFLSLCHDKPIEAVPILIERYNAKRIALNKRTDMTEEEKDDYHNSLQFNITNEYFPGAEVFTDFARIKERKIWT